MREEPFTLAIAGDVMLGRMVDAAMAKRGCEAPWTAVRPLVEDADAFVYNLECAVCGDLPEWEPFDKPFHFRLDTCRAATLEASGVDAVSLANNHIADHGMEGLVETIDCLDGAGIPHAGAGRDLAEARAPALFEASGRTVGLVSAADHPREWGAGAREPGIFLIDPASPASAREVAASVRETRDAGADVVVLGLHWGPNMRRVPPMRFRRFARTMVDAGVDVVWGTSAHLPQGIEFREGGVILYDTGDFLDDYAVDAHERNDLSFLFRVRLDADARCEEVGLAPVRIEGCSTRPARAEEAEWVVEAERRLCAEFGTRLARSGDEWVARPMEDAAPLDEPVRRAA